MAKKSMIAKNEQRLSALLEEVHTLEAQLTESTTGAAADREYSCRWLRLTVAERTRESSAGGRTRLATDRPV